MSIFFSIDSAVSSRIVPILDASHDLAHPVESDGAWSESYYFNCYDPAADTGFFTRIGIRPNEGTMDVGMSVWLPGGDLCEYRAVREQHEMVDRSLVVSDVRYDLAEPMQSWRIRMDGIGAVRPCAGRSAAGSGSGDRDTRRTAQVIIDTTFDALTPGIGADGQSGSRRSSEAAAASAQTVGKGHLEQAGRYTGSITVDGTRHELAEARGNRDRSWGPRRWGGPTMWRWFSINIGDDVHFGGIRIGTAAGDLHRGWVWDGDDATSIREWDVRTELEDDGLTQRVTHVVATDKAGRAHELRGDLQRVAAVGRAGTGATTVVNEGLARFTYEGRTGYGIAEYLHQLDAEGRPVVPVE
jgi:hypothetical protein